MKVKVEVKAKAEVPNPPAEFKIWCEHCCIRIAPFDERTVSKGKTYHARCFTRMAPAAASAPGKRPL